MDGEKFLIVCIQHVVQSKYQRKTQHKIYISRTPKNSQTEWEKKKLHKHIHTQNKLMVTQHQTQVYYSVTSSKHGAWVFVACHMIKLKYFPSALRANHNNFVFVAQNFFIRCQLLLKPLFPFKRIQKIIRLFPFCKVIRWNRILPTRAR